MSELEPVKPTRGTIVKHAQPLRSDNIARLHAQATVPSASETLCQYYRAIASIFQSVESNARSRRSIIRRIDRMCKAQTAIRKRIAGRTKATNAK